jgi:SAM-dependent methyltransferase
MASTPAAPHPLHLLLPRIGTDPEMRALRELLDRSDFTAAGICRRLEIAEVVDFKGIRQGRTTALDITAPVDVFIRLMLDGEFVAQSVLDSLLQPGALALLESLNVAIRDSARPDRWFSPITMYPAEPNLLLAGDRATTPDGSRYWLPPDVVYPGVIHNTREFLASLPQTPCDTLLDLGTGSGVAALIASKYAGQVWGVDIAARSVHFAEFNRRLNGVGHVTMLEGDLYDPVRGLTFDRIVTHPPYVPAAKTRLIFRDGGDDGEQILRRAIEGLPDYLRPGGRFYSLVLGADREGEAFEDRIRKWLGPRQAEFDCVMISHSLRPPREFVANSLAKETIALEDLKFWTDSWRQRNVQFLFYGSILLRRHAGNREPLTARVQKGEGFRPAHQDWLLDWHTESRDPAAVPTLLGFHPAIAPDCELRVLHRLREGRFTPEVFGLQTSGPFVSELHCQSWLVALISNCDGSKTWAEQLDHARREHLIAPEVTPEEFAGLLGVLAANGVLRIDERPLM